MNYEQEIDDSLSGIFSKLNLSMKIIRRDYPIIFKLIKERKSKYLFDVKKIKTNKWIKEIIKAIDFIVESDEHPTKQRISEITNISVYYLKQNQEVLATIKDRIEYHYRNLK